MTEEEEEDLLWVEMQGLNLRYMKKKKSRDTVHSRNTNVHPCHLVLNLNYFLSITVLYTKIPSERCILHYFCTCKSWTCFDVKNNNKVHAVHCVT